VGEEEVLGGFVVVRFLHHRPLKFGVEFFEGLDHPPPAYEDDLVTLTLGHAASFVERALHAKRAVNGGITFCLFHKVHIELADVIFMNKTSDLVAH